MIVSLPPGGAGATSYKSNAFYHHVRMQWIDQKPRNRIVEVGVPSDFPRLTHSTAQSLDYHYRPAVMEDYPLYFFLAGTHVTRTSTSQTWDWHVASDLEQHLFRNVVRSAENIEERRDHPA